MADAGIWWGVVRRSFGVPDPAVGFGGDSAARDAWVGRVVDQVAATGAAGGLDRLLVDEVDAQHVAAGIAEALGPARPVGNGAPHVAEQPPGD